MAKKGLTHVCRQPLASFWYRRRWDPSPKENHPRDFDYEDIRSVYPSYFVISLFITLSAKWNVYLLVLCSVCVSFSRFAQHKVMYSTDFLQFSRHFINDNTLQASSMEYEIFAAYKFQFLWLFSRKIQGFPRLEKSLSPGNGTRELNGLEHANVMMEKL